MIATLKEINWNEGKSGIPYGVMKAVAVQGDPAASAVDEDGFVNPLACMSRTFNLTKCVFPGSMEQAAAMQAAYQEGIKMRLGLFSIPMGKKFNIVGGDGDILCDEKQVEKVADKDGMMDGKFIKKGTVYTDVELVPRVYDSVSLVLFVDKEGNSIENDGEAVDAIALRNFKAGVEKGTYILVD